jgi:hypothetical protein
MNIMHFSKWKCVSLEKLQRHLHRPYNFCCFLLGFLELCARDKSSLDFFLKEANSNIPSAIFFVSPYIGFSPRPKK